MVHTYGVVRVSANRLSTKIFEAMVTDGNIFEKFVDTPNEVHC